MPTAAQSSAPVAPPLPPRGLRGGLGRCRRCHRPILRVESWDGAPEMVAVEPEPERREILVSRMGYPADAEHPDWTGPGYLSRATTFRLHVCRPPGGAGPCGGGEAA